MPKRPNPYSEDIQPQIKIHIGAKEYNNTVEKMKSVYDKTIAILYKGANQKNNNSFDIVKTEDSFKEDGSVSQNKRKFKQMFLGKNGALQSAGTLHIDILKPCGQCKKRLSDMDDSCGYCDSPQCIMCAVTCTSCGNPTCTSCSVNGYGSQSGLLCLTCCR